MSQFPIEKWSDRFPVEQACVAYDWMDRKVQHKLNDFIDKDFGPVGLAVHHVLKYQFNSDDMFFDTWLRGRMSEGLVVVSKNHPEAGLIEDASDIARPDDSIEAKAGKLTYHELKRAYYVYDSRWFA